MSSMLQFLHQSQQSLPLLDVALATALVLSMVLLGFMWRKYDSLRSHQRELLRQLEAVHQAQMAYAEATEGAMSHMRDGLASLTTVSANLEMKTYSLELQAQAARSVAAAGVRAKQPTPSIATTPSRGLTRAEQELMAAVSARN